MSLFSSDLSQLGTNGYEKIWRFVFDSDLTEKEYLPLFWLNLMCVFLIYVLLDQSGERNDENVGWMDREGGC